MIANDTPRILICRLSAVGDCILTTPLLCALREHYPNAFLAWAVEPAAATLLKGHRALDQIIVLEKRWLKSWQQIRSVRKELRGLQFASVVHSPPPSKSSTQVVAPRVVCARRT